MPSDRILSVAKTLLLAIGAIALLLVLIALASSDSVPSIARNTARALLPLVLFATFVVVVVIAYKIVGESDSIDSDSTDGEREPFADVASGRQIDHFERGQFVRSIVHRIDSTSLAEESTVFGLVGAWGSGKTTIIAEVQARLDPSWKTIQFSPWSAADPTGVGLEFLRVLNSALELRSDHERRSTIARYAQYVVPVASALPVIGAGLGATIQRSLDHASIPSPWHEEFQRVSRMLLSARKRVLVIVDDVDRLAPPELDVLLRVLRLLGRFHNVHYLVAYDQNSIEELIGASGATIRAQNYMEKIVQVPFEVPPLSVASTNDLLAEALRRLLNLSGEALDEEGDGRATELLGILVSQARTPRAIERFGHQLDTFASHVTDAELDPLDFVAVTWLRLNHHATWEALSGWKSELLSGKRQVGLLKYEPISQEEWLEKISNLNGKNSSREVLLVLSFLFEALTLDDYPRYQQHDHGMGSEEYFERYMVLDLPRDDISDRLVKEGLKALSDGVASRQAHALVEAIRSDASTRASAAVNKAASIRTITDHGSRPLFLFLADAYRHRENESFRFGTVGSALTDWMLREILLALRDSEISADDLRKTFPGEESLKVAHRLSRNLQLRHEAKKQLASFARAWLNDLQTERFELLLDQGTVRLIISLADWTLQEEEVEGVLAEQVTDLNSFTKVAGGFAYFHEWVGRSTHWELDFDGSAFRRAVGEVAFARFAPLLAPTLPAVSYAVDDLPAREVTDEVEQDYIARRIQQLWQERGGPKPGVA